jgi:hypothetical protein
MYIVKLRSTGETVAVCSRPEDAAAWLRTSLHGNTYTVTPKI